MDGRRLKLGLVGMYFSIDGFFFESMTMVLLVEGHCQNSSTSHSDSHSRSTTCQHFRLNPYGHDVVANRFVE